MASEIPKDVEMAMKKIAIPAGISHCKFLNSIIHHSLPNIAN